MKRGVRFTDLYWQPVGNETTDIGGTRSPPAQVDGTLVPSTIV